MANSELFIERQICFGEKDTRKKVSVLACTVAGDSAKQNEDAFGFNATSGAFYCGVFDGTTSHCPIEKLGNKTGAIFASNFVSEQLSAFDDMDSLSLKKFLVLVNEKLLTETMKLGVTLEEKAKLPGSTGTIIKLDAKNKKFSVAHVSDSFCVICYDGGRTELITNNLNKKFDEAGFKLIRRVAKEKGITPREARYEQNVKDIFAGVPAIKNNRPDGQGTGLINGDPNMGPYIYEREKSLEGVSAILLGTDGLIPLGYSLDSQYDRKNMINLIRRENSLKPLIEMIKMRQDDDSDWRYTRYKHSDDATGIFIDLNPYKSKPSLRFNLP